LDWSRQCIDGIERYDEALAAYDRALSLNPDSPGIESLRLLCKLNVCDWSNFRSECEHLALGAKNNKANTDPFSLTAISESREDQLKCAKLWIGEKYRASSKPLWNGESYNHNRVRVGYVSADFRQHAVSYLIAGMFECHDKRQFEITAISIGPDDGSELRNRVKNAFDDFVDGSLLSDDEIAHQIKQKESDNLVDVNGFTRDARTGIFALRAAPIQVNYLGYPGTMGANYIDYIIADRTLVPQSHQQDYSEKIVYLPHCYQVNDAKRAISEKRFLAKRWGCHAMVLYFVASTTVLKSCLRYLIVGCGLSKKYKEAFCGSWKLMKPRLAI
jgi:protein O-GlcNAc transferase